MISRSTGSSRPRDRPSCRARNFPAARRRASTISNSNSRPRGCFRFKVTARLFWFSIANGRVALLPGRARRRSGSPRGGSTLITSAPPFASSKRRVRALKNLPEIDDDETGERQPPRSLRVVRHAPSRPLRSQICAGRRPRRKRRNCYRAALASGVGAAGAGGARSRISRSSVLSSFRQPTRARAMRFIKKGGRNLSRRGRGPSAAYNRALAAKARTHIWRALGFAADVSESFGKLLLVIPWSAGFLRVRPRLRQPVLPYSRDRARDAGQRRLSPRLPAGTLSSMSRLSAAKDRA